MDGADGDKERFGPVLRVAALAATLLALAAVIGPRLASSGGGGSTGAPRRLAPRRRRDDRARLRPPRARSLPAAVTTAVHDRGHHDDRSHRHVPPPRRARVVPAASPDSGAVDLALVGVHAGRYGPERSGFFAGDTIGWHFRVTNSGGRVPLGGLRLPGAATGRSLCSARRLDVGESADCWAETTALWRAATKPRPG